MPGRYWPAFGAVDVPHPRTPGDLLFRSFANHMFAAVAYGHLLYLVGFRRAHGIGALPALLIPIGILLPEVILVQLGLAILPALFLRSYRDRVAARFKALPMELGFNSGSGLGRVGLHAGFAVFNAIPLAAVLGAYRQRLGMQWHGRTYVANLGLDHRNGWTAAGGISAVLISLGVLAGLAFVVVGGLAAAAPASANGELPTSSDRDRGKPEAYPDSTDDAMEWFIQSAWASSFEVVLAALIHQILLALTHYPVPVLMILQGWYLWPIVGIVAWYLHRRRRVEWLAIAFALVLGFIAFTIVTSIVWDAHELFQVSHEIYWWWNWRWKVKDQVSAKFDKGV